MGEMLEHPELSPLAAFLHKAIDRSDKTQRQLACEIGLQNPNFLSMLKHGVSKFPLDKVIKAAVALEVDAAHLLRLVLEQCWPRQLHVIEEIFSIVISSREKQLILLIRRLIGDIDPTFTAVDVKRLLEGHGPTGKSLPGSPS